MTYWHSSPDLGRIRLREIRIAPKFRPGGGRDLQCGQQAAAVSEEAENGERRQLLYHYEVPVERQAKNLHYRRQPVSPGV